MVLDGKSCAEIAETLPDAYLRLHKGIDKMKVILEKGGKSRPGIKVRCYWGEAGVGKSSLAKKEAMRIAQFNGWRVYFRTMNGIWMDGYDGQEVSRITNCLWQTQPA
jgi:hypothetical protein